MGRSPCCEKAHTNKGAWTKDEDQRLIDYIRLHGEGCWRSLPKAAGLLRCGKSCRLRWINYLRPDLKRGNFTDEEDEQIIKLHSVFGNKWSLIAGRLTGRTDNEIKNYWNTHIKRKLISRGIDPQTHRPINEPTAGTATKTSDIKPINVTLNLNSKTESIEEGNCSSSGMTTDEEQQQQQQNQNQTQGEIQEINLELSIGQLPTRSELTQFSSAESKLQQIPSFFGSPAVESPVTAAAVVAQAVCLCCQLGFQSSELCRNCQNSNGFLRYWNRALDS